MAQLPQFYSDPGTYGSRFRMPRLPKLSMRGPGRPRHTVQESDGMSPRELRQLIEQSNPDADNVTKQAIYEQLAPQYLASAAKPGRGGKYADEKEARAAKRFEEQEADREERKTGKAERDYERKQKRLEAERTRIESKIDRYETQIDRLNKELGSDFEPSKDRKKTINERLSRLNDELTDYHTRLDNNDKQYNMARTLHETGATEEELAEKFMQRAKGAGTDELEGLQKSADNLGLKVNIRQNKMVQNPFYNNPAHSEEALTSPGMGGYQTNLPQDLTHATHTPGLTLKSQGGSMRPSVQPMGERSLQPQGPQSSFTDQDLMRMRQDAGLVQKQPWISRDDIDQARANLGNVIRTTGRSLNEVYQDPSKFGQSFTQGDFPKEMQESRAASRGTISDYYSNLLQHFATLGRAMYGIPEEGDMSRLMGMAGVPSAAMDLAGGGVPGAALGRVNKGVTENTGSATLGKAAEIGAGFAPIPGMASRLGEMFRRPPSPAPSGPLSLPYTTKALPAPAQWGERPPIPSNRAVVPYEGTPAQFQGGRGPSYPQMPSGVPQLERMREPYVTPGQGPDPFSPMHGPVPAGTPAAAAQHPGFPRPSQFNMPQGPQPMALGNRMQNYPGVHEGPPMPTGGTPGQGAPIPPQYGAPPGAVMPQGPMQSMQSMPPNPMTTQADAVMRALRLQSTPPQSPTFSGYQRPVPRSMNPALARDEAEARRIIEQMGAKKPATKPRQRKQKSQQQQGRKPGTGKEPTNPDRAALRAQEAMKREASRQIRAGRALAPKGKEAAAKDVRKLYIEQTNPQDAPWLYPGYYGK